MRALTNISKPDVLASFRSSHPAIRTSEVYVVLTSADHAARVVRPAGELAHALDVPLTVVHVPLTPAAEETVRMAGLCRGVMDELAHAGINARARVYACRAVEDAIPVAFAPRSIVFIAVRRRRWPSVEHRWRRLLEDAGHFVVSVSVDPANDEESSHA